MQLRDMQIVIIGGGIGGLTAALALRARGATVQVLEQAAAITEVGAGIQVSPNGLRVLAALGLDGAMRAASLQGQAVVLRDYRGAEVLRMDLSQLADAGDYRFVHRADIIDLLAQAARDRGVRIQLLQRAVDVVPGPRPRVVLAHGDELEADLVIGADGLHSVLRPVLNGTAKPFFTGQVAWRALVPNSVDHPPEARVHMGPGRHVVSYPLRDGALVNLVAVEERRGWVEEGWTQTDDAANLRASFAEFRGPIRQLINAAEAPGLWGLFRHPVAAQWQGEGVALLGDAAHPTLPFLAQGANMAIEDAWALTAALSLVMSGAKIGAGAEGRSEDRSGHQSESQLGRQINEGLALYQGWRRDRVAKVIAAANGNAWKYHLRNPLLRGVAHLGLGVVGRLAPDRMLGQFDWIYGYDVTQLGLSGVTE